MPLPDVQKDITLQVCMFGVWTMSAWYSSLVLNAHYFASTAIRHVSYTALHPELGVDRDGLSSLPEAEPNANQLQQASCMSSWAALLHL